MLRSLKVFETNADGSIALDRTGQPIALPEEAQQPKTRKEMSPGELRYVDEIAPAQERELWKSRARRIAEDKALTFAAEALAKRAGQEDAAE